MLEDKIELPPVASCLFVAELINHMAHSCYITDVGSLEVSRKRTMFILARTFQSSREA